MAFDTRGLAVEFPDLRRRAQQHLLGLGTQVRLVEIEQRVADHAQAALAAEMTTAFTAWMPFGTWISPGCCQISRGF